MNTENILKTISAAKIVPVIKITNVDHALPLADALTKGNIPVGEITLRSPEGLPSIKKLAAERPNFLLGAGTILSIDDARSAIECGAKFLVTPGFNPKVVDYCVRNKWLIVPGINSPSGVEQGMEFGLNILKFFPAEASGGVAMLKSLAGPYGNIKFMPTGGVGLSNLKNYLSLKNVIAVGGSWMVEAEKINSGKFDEIAQISQESVKAAG